MVYRTVDVRGLLDELGVDYRVTGTNVASNDVNIDCPYCGDSRKHLAIHKEKGILNCWSCGLEHINPRPQLVDLVMEIDGCSRVEAGALIREYKDSLLLPENKHPDRDVVVPDNYFKVEFPWATISFSRIGTQVSRARIYLATRGFSDDTVVRYGLKVCVSGFYAGRIIIPIERDGELVSWLGRDYTGCSQLRYRNCPRNKCKITNKETLYNIDAVKALGQSRHLRIVEGVTDCWRMDDSNTVAVFTNKISKAQMGLIISELKPKSISLLFDGDFDSLYHAKQAARLMYPIIPKIKIVNLGGCDVASRKRDEVIGLEEITPWFN